MKPLILLLFVTALFSVDELTEAKAKIPDPVFIVFDLTVINKDKGTTETVRIQDRFFIAAWEKAYRPLTLLELKGYPTNGYIKALPVTITIQTL